MGRPFRSRSGCLSHGHAATVVTGFMKKLRFVLAAVYFGTPFFALCASAPAAVSTLTVKLDALNGSGESGTATLTQLPDGVRVVVLVTNPATVPQPTHIHVGSCGNDTALAYGLTNTTDGTSTTVVKNVTIEKLLNGTYSINVHKSTSDLATYVSCGNVKT